MKKLTCHCGEVEVEVGISENSLEKVRRCNCSLCKRKGAIMAMVETEKLKIIKGESKLGLYKYHTKVAQHFFCRNCGIRSVD